MSNQCVAIWSTSIRVFPLESTKEALTYVEQGRAKGKVVVKVG
ncbi:hypothetical protein EEB14_45630 [Rhodococcus sp. WS4]|nr:hypothetical protein EEB14_45630 [Rhodococcus sp. WS4]